MNCTRKLTPKFQDIFTNIICTESRSTCYSPSKPYPIKVTKVLPSSPIVLSSLISKGEILVHPAEKDPISQEYQHSSEAYKRATQLMTLQELKLRSLFHLNSHSKV